MNVSRDRKLQCIDRELGFRKRLYPRFVEQRKITQDFADEEIAVLESIREDYIKTIPLIRKVETQEGFNIVIGERWAAHFPKESESQIDLLIEKIGVVTHTDETKP